MAILLYFLFVVSLSTIIFIINRTFQFYRLRLPPGNFGLPFIGETVQFMSAYKTESPEPFINKKVNQFGPLFTTHVYGEPTVFSVDPETNRFILQNEGKLFECSYPGSISNLLGKHSLLLMKGSLHKRMHSFTMGFTNSSTIKDHLLVDIDRLVRFNLDSWRDRVFLLDEAKKITFDLTMKQLLSLDPCEWIENLRKEFVLVMQGFFSVPIPILSATYRKAIKARNKVAEALRLIVRQRRMESKEGQEKKDILGALLAVDEGLSEEEIVDFLVALLVAGYDTTSITITLAVKFLTDTPLALAQLKEEHEQIGAKKREGEAFEWADYKSMPFTHCVVNETLRLGNVIGGVFRRALTDINIKGYTIPKGWKVWASFRAAHLDHDNFKDAATFDPWRWQNGGSASPGNNVFTPFGGGPRLCPGYELSKVEVCVFLHYLVTRFSWFPDEEDKLVFFPTTRMEKRYPINLYRGHR